MHFSTQRKHLLPWLLMLFFAMPGFSGFSQIDVNGFVDTYHAVRLKEPVDFLNSRTRLRGELQAVAERAYLFASFNIVENNVLDGQSGFFLNEAFLEYIQDSWDIRIGRQIIIWGKADGIQITDIVSPQDYTEFFAQDYDDLRMPVEAVKLRLLPDIFDLELIWIPFFKASIYPTGDNPWVPESDIPDTYSYAGTDLPDNELSNGEIGGRISFYLPKIDFSLSSLYTWDDTPFVHLNVSDSTYEYEHHRLLFIGADCSFPLDDFVFRGEAAFYFDKYFEPDEISEEPFKKNVINALVGVDWYPGNNWSIIAQLNERLILDYEGSIADDKLTTLITLNVSKKLLREILELSNMLYLGLNDLDLFDQLSIDYALTDELHFMVGADIFAGEEGFFGQYRENTSAWIKAKYSF